MSPSWNKVIIIITIIIISYFLLTTPHKGFFSDNLQFERKSNRHSSNRFLQLFSTNQIKSNQIKCWFFLERGENRSTLGKTSHSRVENQQTQSTLDPQCRNRTRATLVEGKCSHHYANPATMNSGPLIHLFMATHMHSKMRSLSQ